MQKRHTDRKMYFHDLEITSKEFYISSLSTFIKSQHTNVAFSQISEKYAFASIILHSAMSIPVTLQPSWAKGTKLPPSPQPTSNTLLFEVNFLKVDK